MKELSRRFIFVAALLFFLTFSLSGGGKSESKDEKIDWPSKTIQIVSGGSPGGDTDFNGRALTTFLSKELGKPVIIVNIIGAGGSVAARHVHDADPDGYTLLVAHTSLLISKSTGMIGWGLDGYELIGIVSENAGDIVVVNSTSKFKTLKDVIDAAKLQPNTVRMAVNTGSTTQVISSMLEDKAGIKFNIVDGGGAAEKAVALLGGQIDVTILPYGTAKSHIAAGDFIPLAVIKSERNKKFPDIPTAVEQGYDVVLPVRYFLLMTKGTPKDIVNKFTAATKKIVTENAEYAKMIDKAFSQVPMWIDADKAMAESGKLQALVDKYAKR